MARFFSQMFIQGVAAISKAFYAAYHLALQNARVGGARGGAVKGGIRRDGKMQADEALKILNIERPNLSRRSIEEQYEKYFESNDPAKGGSFYLQSKIFRAKEALEKELMAERKQQSQRP